MHPTGMLEHIVQHPSPIGFAAAVGGGHPPRPVRTGETEPGDDAQSQKLPERTEELDRAAEPLDDQDAAPCVPCNERYQAKVCPRPSSNDTIGS